MLTVNLERSGPVNVRSGFKFEMVFGNVGFERMIKAISCVNSAEILNPTSAAPVVDGNLDIVHAADIPVPNPSQLMAIRAAQHEGFTLIQGPPGTGKSHVAAHIVANLPGKVLVCTPSNSAADNLTLILLKAGIKVVRMMARIREHRKSPVFDHTVVGILSKDDFTYRDAKERIRTDQMLSLIHI